MRAAAEVDGERHHLRAVLLPEPGDGDGRIESAGVGEHDLLHRDRASVGLAASAAALRASNRSSQPRERGLVGEQDDERVVAGDRAHEAVEGRLLDRLGDDVGGAGLPVEHEDEPAPADRDGDVREDPAQPLVGRGTPRADGLGHDVDRAVAAHHLGQAQLRDVAAHGGLGDLEAEGGQLADELALAGDGAGGDQPADRRVPVPLDHHHGRPSGRAGVGAGADPGPERRVVEGAGEGVRRRSRPR